MAGAVHKAGLAALAPGLGQARGLGAFELFDVVDTDTHFEQIQCHDPERRTPFLMTQ